MKSPCRAILLAVILCGSVPPLLEAAESSPPSGIPAAQMQAAQEALRAIRKLESAVYAGLSYIQYSNRFTDMMVEAREKLRGVPMATFLTYTNEVSAAIVAYEDARKVWNIAITDDYVKLYLIHVEPIFRKHDVYFYTEDATYDMRFSYESARRRYLYPALSQIWDVASEHIKKADQALKKCGSVSGLSC